MFFPSGDAPVVSTRLVIDTPGETGRLPVVRWLGVPGTGDTAEDILAVSGEKRGCPLLVEHSRPSYARPGLRGHRLSAPAGSDKTIAAGRDWSTAFRPTGTNAEQQRLVIEARDDDAGLGLRTEIESLEGGALRIRHSVTNLGAGPYMLEALEVAVPVPEEFTEILDFTGRHERERVPQRHPIRDGLWARESRRGRPGLDSASALVAGTAGFGFNSGEVVSVHVASSGNSTMSAARGGSEGPTVSAGELLLPGEVALGTGEIYTMPWVVVAASRDGLDSLAASLHAWQRSLPAHPAVQTATLNVWEAVYFDHDIIRLENLARRAARIGMERFVLDDGWFRGRRDDRAGLGDWQVDAGVYPDGLGPLIKLVHELSMEFGLWIEPEMVNPDSDLFRRHPDWILSAGDRRPVLERNQYVLDLTNDLVREYLSGRLDELLSTNEVDYVKWDHNRDLLEAGSLPRGGSPAARRQYQAFYSLLDELRARHPGVAWESCASGGGRVDLGVIERVQRVWTSDITDALARQQIQRWTTQIVAPEYLGAHVSATVSQQTGRTLPLDFRAATALFGAFGVEWDLSLASEAELERLAQWCALYKRYRPLLHTGRTVRLETSDPAVLAHGVIAADGGAGLIAHVQLDESVHNRGVTIRLPRLDRQRTYLLEWEGPAAAASTTAHELEFAPAGPARGQAVSGAVLEDVGIWLPRCRPETIRLIAVVGSTA